MASKLVCSIHWICFMLDSLDLFHVRFTLSGFSFTCATLQHVAAYDWLCLGCFHFCLFPPILLVGVTQGAVDRQFRIDAASVFSLISLLFIHSKKLLSLNWRLEEF